MNRFLQSRDRSEMPLLLPQHDHSHPSHFSALAQQHDSLPHAQIDGDPDLDLDWNSTQTDHTILYENLSIAYRAVEAMWEAASVVLHSARLRVNTLDRRACNAFRRFFRPFVLRHRLRFAPQRTAQNPHLRPLRSEPIRNPAINLLACATQSFDSQLLVLPLHLDVAAVVECADKFSIALFSAVAEIYPQHDHCIVEYFAMLHKAPTPLMMLACGVSEKESGQHQWLARMLFSTSPRFDLVLCLPKNSARVGKGVLRDFSTCCVALHGGTSANAQNTACQGLDRHECSIRPLGVRPT